MSTDIKPGMEGRAVRDTASMGGTKIPQSTVVTVTALPAEPHLFIGGNGERMGMTLRVDDFLFVPVYGDVTPAPLDPAAVIAITLKSGDYIEAKSDGTKIGGKVSHVTERGFVAIEHLGEFAIHGITPSPLPSGYRMFALTDHQPAPEPEPEWKPGTVGTATVLYRGQSGPVASTRLMRVFRTSGVVAPGETALPWVDDLGNLLSDEQIADFVLDRPLPTRDQVIEALEGHQFFTDRVMALLDGAR